MTAPDRFNPIQAVLDAAWSPSSGSNPGTATGWEFGSAGTVTTPAITAGTLRSQSRRTRWTSATASNAAAGLISSDALCLRGNSAGLGGFYFNVRFSISTNVASSRAFVGLAASSSSVVSAEPSSFSNIIGIGFDAADSSGGNWQLICGGASAAKLDLAAGGLVGGTAARNTTDLYELTVTRHV